MKQNTKDGKAATANKEAKAKLTLHGLKKARNRDGSVLWYMRGVKGGSALPGEYRPGEYISPEFQAAYDGHRPAAAGGRSETLADLFAEFSASKSFDNRARSKKHRTNVLYMYDVIKKARVDGGVPFGKTPVKMLDTEGFKKDFMKWKSAKAAVNPRTSDNLVCSMARVLAWATAEFKVKGNWLAKFERAYVNGQRAECIWSPAIVQKFLKEAPREYAEAVFIAYCTGQRLGDIIALQWEQWDGECFSLTQSKTGMPVLVPAPPRLRDYLNSMERRGDFILTTAHGKPWTQNYFSRKFGALTRKIGCNVEVNKKKGKVKRLTFHDLRGTAITLLADAGCSASYIASISGHTETSINAMLTIYKKRTETQARKAIDMLNAHTDFAEFEELTRLKLPAPVKMITDQRRAA